MKRLRYLLLLTLTFAGLQSFTLPNWAVSEIMQAIVELEPMNQVWEKGNSSQKFPIYLVTNDHFPENPQFSINDQTVKIISPKEVDQLEADEFYINVTKFRIKKDKKARLEFTYNGIQVKVNMIKQEDKWGHRSLSIVGKGIHHKSLDWTF